VCGMKIFFVARCQGHAVSRVVTGLRTACYIYI
jgi:hypothetical protein